MIRKIVKEDKNEYLRMTDKFYHSQAVTHSINPEYFENTFSELMRSDEYAECYIIEKDSITAGYALLAKTFSQEAGGKTVWLEELYIKPEFRKLGLASQMLTFLNDNIFPGIKRLRLEVTPENITAANLYRKFGFENLDYLQMIKDN